MLSTDSMRFSRIGKSTAWLDLAYYVVVGSGLSVDVSLALLALMYHGVHEIKWWAVLLPIALATLFVHLLFTIAIAFWVHKIAGICRGQAEGEHGREPRLEMLFRCAKLCFTGHLNSGLLILSLTLIYFKLDMSPDMPIVYPGLPLLVLGFLCVFKAVMFKSPEVNAAWSLFVGVWLLAQTSFMVLKLDYYPTHEHFPWGIAFCPSWCSYGFVLIWCIHSGAGGILALLEHKGQSSQAEGGGTGDGVADYPDATKEREEVAGKVRLVVGAALGACGLAATHVMLTLRLDGVSNLVPWLGLVCPALVGWTILVATAAPTAAGHFNCVTRLLLDVLDIMPLDDDEDEDDVEAPLLSGVRRFSGPPTPGGRPFRARSSGSNAAL